MMRLILLAKFLPAESISRIYLNVLVSEAYFGLVHEKVTTALRESAGAGETVAAEALNVTAVPFP